MVEQVGDGVLVSEHSLGSKSKDSDPAMYISC